jgi:hypothetical protein
MGMMTRMTHTSNAQIRAARRCHAVHLSRDGMMIWDLKGMMNEWKERCYGINETNCDESTKRRPLFLSSWFILLPRMGVLSQAKSSQRGAMIAGFHRVWPSFVFYAGDVLASIGLPTLFRSFFHLSSIDER